MSCVGALLCQLATSSPNRPDVTEFIKTVEPITAGLFAVVLTLVALVPPLAEMSKAGGSSYFASTKAKETLATALNYLSWSLAVFAISMLVGGVGVLWPSTGLAIAVAAIDLVGLGIVVIAGARLSKIARDWL